MINNNIQMKLFLNKITNQSIKNNKDNAPFKSIRLFVNLVCVCACFGLILTIIDLIKFGTLTNNLIGHLNLLIMYAVVFYINYKGFYKVAALIFIFYLIFGFFLFGAKLTPNIFAEFNLLIIPCVALMLFRKLLIPILSLITSFTAFSIVFRYHTSYGNSNHFPEYFVLFTSLFVIVNYFKNNNLKNEKLLKNEKNTIKEQANELKRLNEFKSHFFVNLSHEIRTPITLIKGYTSKIKLKKNDDNKQNIDIVNSQIQQVENILNNILDLSKLDANKLYLEKQQITLPSFLNKHFTHFKGLFLEKKIHFKINNPIPEIAIDMDANLVSKSINNLLSNALKFTSEKGTVEIKVTLNEELKIAIIDNGLGIPNKDLDKVFERFYQSKNDITQSQGSGIGLTFTKSILEAHGFSIDVTSEPNVKTEFIITIPKKHFISSIKNDIIFNIRSTNQPLENIKINKEKPTILVVDDHEQMRDYLKGILNNYNILEAENGQEALTVLKNKSVDLLLTDYMMPVMNGEELVKNVKKLQLKIPIIIITARVDDFAKLNMLRIGVDGYLNKPFVEEELLLFIKNSLKAYYNIIAFEEALSVKEQEEINQYSVTFTREITALIKNRISEINFGVQDVANHFDISKRTLNRKVKSILGQTTQQLIIQARIEKARELQIKKPNMSQKEIASTVGMSNAVHLFKKLSEFYGDHYITLNQ